MISEKLREVIETPPDAGLTIVTQGPEGPHVVNSWNSYIHIVDGNKLLLPAGGFENTEKNLAENDMITLAISNRNVDGKLYKGTGFVVEGKAKFASEGPLYDTIKRKFEWARAVMIITVESAIQTL